MPLQAKSRRRVTSRRRTAVVPARARGGSRPSSRTHKPTPRTRKKSIPIVLETKPKAPPGSSSGYLKALKFLETLTDYERLRIVRYNAQNFDLDRMRHLLKRLGNPQEHFKSVHIAGTKGKGSTCAMVASMLQANGYKVGVYTSPHLCDIRERIAVSGQMIPHADFARLIRLVEPIVMRSKPMPTFFDVITAVAFKYFAEQKIDIDVVETGVTGRLDTNNVQQHEGTPITSTSKNTPPQHDQSLR